jgi:hypothetical protein
LTLNEPCSANSRGHSDETLTIAWLAERARPSLPRREFNDVRLEEAGLTALAALAGKRGKSAAKALAALLHRHGLEQTAQTLARWSSTES